MLLHGVYSSSSTGYCDVWLFRYSFKHSGWVGADDQAPRGAVSRACHWMVAGFILSCLQMLKVTMVLGMQHCRLLEMLVFGSSDIHALNYAGNCRLQEAGLYRCKTYERPSRLPRGMWILAPHAIGTCTWRGCGALPRYSRVARATTERDSWPMIMLAC